MKLYELLQSGIDFQSEWKVVKFDFNAYRRYEVDPTEYEDEEIGYMYVEHDILYIELVSEE